MMDLSKLNWHDINYFHDIPEKVIFWIRDDQSLTQKLKKRYPDFKTVGILIVFIQVALASINEYTLSI